MGAAQGQRMWELSAQGLALSRPADAVLCGFSAFALPRAPLSPLPAENTRGFPRRNHRTDSCANSVITTALVTTEKLHAR